MSEHRRKFLTSIVHAGGAAAVGNKKEMENNLKEAKVHHKTHIEDFKTTANPDEVEKENQLCNDYYGKVRSIFDGSHRTKKSESVESTLIKAVGPASLPDKVMIRGANKGQERFPSKDTSYNTYAPTSKDHDYVHHNDLTPPQQAQAHKIFGGRDMHSYHYAVKDGQVQSKARTKFPPQESNAGTSQTTQYNSGNNTKPAPEADKKFVSDHGKNPKLKADEGEALPHHAAGQSVRIHSEGHEHHGRIGKVKEPSPYHPGKIHVELLRRTGKVEAGRQSVFLDPDHAHPHSIQSKIVNEPTQKSEDNVVKLARTALERLKKRG